MRVRKIEEINELLDEFSYLRWVMTKDGKEQNPPCLTYLDCWIDWVGCTNQSVEDFWKAVERCQKDGYKVVKKDFRLPGMEE